MITEKPVGICPACGEAVFSSREGDDGPVWTCRSDLQTTNPFYEELPEDWQTTEEQKEEDGYYANCPEGRPCHEASCGGKPGHWHQCPHEYPGGPGHMPLHAACYDKGDY
jgi:hypothetical protein